MSITQARGMSDGTCARQRDRRVQAPNVQSSNVQRPTEGERIRADLRRWERDRRELHRPAGSEGIVRAAKPASEDRSAGFTGSHNPISAILAPFENVVAQIRSGSVAYSLLPWRVCFLKA